MKGKNLRVPAAHPYPNIPKVPSPVWLLPVPSKSGSTNVFFYYEDQDKGTSGHLTIVLSNQ